jgi:hypothetical protein
VRLGAPLALRAWWLTCTLLCGGAGAQQLLLNPSFSEMNGLSPLHWTSSGGFVAVCGASCGSSDVHPAVASGVLRFGREAAATVSQTVSVPMRSTLSTLELAFRVRKPNAPEAVFYVELRLLNGAGGTVSSLRFPATGTRNATNSWETFTLEAERSAIANFDTIASASVILHGRQSPYIWSGHYGAAFDDVTLTAIDGSMYAEIAELVTGSVNEGGTLSLTSPTGVPFEDLIFASYGTPTGNGWPFVQSSCHAANSRTQAGAAFVANLSGSIAARNSLFGDPCGGVAKRLAVALAAPRNIAAGLPVNAPQPLLLVVRDAAGNVDASYQGTATLAGTAGISGQVGPFLNGVLATTVTPTVAGGNRTLVVSLDDRNTSATLSLSIVSTSVPVVATEPAAGPAVGTPLLVQPRVEIRDGGGNVVSDATGEVDVTIISGLGGSFTGRPPSHWSSVWRSLRGCRSSVGWGSLMCCVSRWPAWDPSTVNRWCCKPPGRSPGSG